MISPDGAEPVRHNRGGGVAPPHRGSVVARDEPRETKPAGGETILTHNTHRAGGYKLGTDEAPPTSESSFGPWVG